MNEFPLNIPLVFDSNGNACFFIDNSSMDSVQACTRKAEYAVFRKRIAATDAPALNFGTAIHHALKLRYGHPVWAKTATPECTDAQLELLAMHFEQNPQPMDNYRTPTMAKNIITAYNKFYQMEPWDIVVDANGKRLVEVSFAHYLGDIILPYGLRHGERTLHSIKIFFTGKIDLVIENTTGIWVYDHKTAYMFGQSFWKQQQMSYQFRGYCWAYQQSYGALPVGFGIDAIRTTPPKKTDKFNPEFDGTPIKRDDLARDFFLIDQSMIDVWKKNMLAILTELFIHAGNGFFPERHAACVSKYGACEYCMLCEMPEDARLPILYSHEYMENTWTPLNQPNPSKKTTD